jgi:hypothetical protein
MLSPTPTLQRRRCSKIVLVPLREIERSLVFIGDYEREYFTEVAALLERRHGEPLKSDD